MEWTPELIKEWAAVVGGVIAGLGGLAARRGARRGAAEGMNGTGEAVGRIERKLDGIEGRLERGDRRFDGLEGEVREIGSKIAGLDEKVRRDQEVRLRVLESGRRQERREP